MDNKKEDVELAVLYIILKRLMQKPEDFDAYDLGLIDKNFKILREPENDEEEEALSPLNVFIFTLRNAFGPRILTLFKFLYLNNYSEDYVLDKLMTKGIISSRSDVARMAKDLKRKIHK